MESLYDNDLNAFRSRSRLSLASAGGDEEDDPYISSLWEIHRKLDNLRGRMSKQQIGESELNSDEIGEDGMSLPPTYLVIQVSPHIKEKTLNWLLEKISGKRRDGGAELIVMRHPSDPKEGFILHLSASKIKLLESAEEMEIIKEDRQGVVREFIVSQMEDFIPEGMHINDFLTQAEKQSIVRHEIENIRALPEDSYIPGYFNIPLYEGQSIFQACLKNNLIIKVFPLHDDEALKKLARNWYYTFFSKQPFEDIRLYFGESITLYFTFLGYYTTALIIPVILGLLQFFVITETMPFFCLFNVVWVTVFLEMWKRKSNALAFKWGTIGMTSLYEEPRPNFQGPMGYDAVTGKLQPQSPRYRTTLKMYLVSFPIVFVCMLGAFVMMLMSFWADEYVKYYYSDNPIILNAPSIIYSILVAVSNIYYRQFAIYLTEWENHRTPSQYERHRVTKLVLFEFVNNFMALFYIAFITQDMDMLRSQVQIMLVVQQAINNFQEAIFPLGIKYYSAKLSEWKKFIFGKKTEQMRLHYSLPGFEGAISLIPCVPYDDSRVKATDKEIEMEHYEGTYDDYLELFIQFGYVFLFSAVYPIAAVWAVLNNIIEIRADAFKLCKIFQRPMCRKVKDIGAWQRWFEVLGAMSIITNCGLLMLSPNLREEYMYISQTRWILYFVLFEHFLLGLRYIIHIAISDKPEWVRVALAKRNYQSKQALKFERSQKNRHLLTRKFKTVHGLHGK